MPEQGLEAGQYERAAVPLAASSRLRHPRTICGAPVRDPAPRHRQRTRSVPRPGSAGGRAGPIPPLPWGAGAGWTRPGTVGGGEAGLVAALLPFRARREGFGRRCPPHSRRHAEARDGSGGGRRCLHVPDHLPGPCQPPRRAERRAAPQMDGCDRLPRRYRDGNAPAGGGRGAEGGGWRGGGERSRGVPPPPLRKVPSIRRLSGESVPFALSRHWPMTGEEGAKFWPWGAGRGGWGMLEGRVHGGV